MSDFDDYDDFGDDELCPDCDGDGWGILGETFFNEDPINEPDGEVVRCPNCGGSGRAKDCQFW